MSIPRIPAPARLLLSILTRDKSAVEAARGQIEAELGPIEDEVGPLAFDFTDYYEREMGAGIQRWLWIFAELVDRGELARIKLLTNHIESSYSINGKRRFNLDPGLLTLENFILATGKNRADRIYLGHGIFADLTLVFRQGTYSPLPWTYPDYADTRLIEILNRIREAYKCTLKRQTNASPPSRA